MADEEIVEVKTVKADPPNTTGIALVAVVMAVAMGLIIFSVKYSGEPPATLDTTQTQIK